MSVHAVRSDSDGRRKALGNLNAAFGMPSSIMEGNMMPGSFVREANEKVDGYDTIRFFGYRSPGTPLIAQSWEAPEKARCGLAPAAARSKWSILTFRLFEGVEYVKHLILHTGFTAS